MSVAAPLLGVVALMGGLLGAMTVLARVARAHDWLAEVQRKLVHVAAGMTAMALPWVFAADWPVWLLLALTLLAMIGLRTGLLGRLGHTVHGVERKSWGDLLLVVAVGLVFLFSDREPVLYVLPLAILTLADAAAALAGSHYGRMRFAVADGQKSVEGSAVFFVVTFCVTIVALLLLSPLDRVSTVLVSVLIAGFATLVEADSWNGFDNLFLPLGTMILLRATDFANAEGLALRLGLLFAVIVAALVLSRRTGARAQVLRVHILALFLILNVTALQNAVLPVLMLAAHGLARREWVTHDPARAALECVGALAILSFGSEALGAATGHNALMFYALATGGAALGYGGLWLSARPLHWRVLGAAMGLAAIFGLWLWVAWMNPVSVHWYTAPPWVFAALLALSLAGALLAPWAFATQTTLRVTFLSGGLALGLFLHQMTMGG